MGVSLGVPLGDGQDQGFSKLAVVKIDANSGKVESVQQDELERGRSGQSRSDGTEP